MSAGTDPKERARVLREAGHHEQAAEHLARHLAYGAALGARPGAGHIETEPNQLVLRLLRRTRWFALLCLVIAALVTVLVPLTDRGTVQTLVLTGAVPVVLAMWYGSARRRVAREQQGRTT